MKARITLFVLSFILGYELNNYHLRKHMEENRKLIEIKMPIGGQMTAIVIVHGLGGVAFKVDHIERLHAAIDLAAESYIESYRAQVRGMLLEAVKTPQPFEDIKRSVDEHVEAAKSEALKTVDALKTAYHLGIEPFCDLHPTAKIENRVCSECVASVQGCTLHPGTGWTAGGKCKGCVNQRRSDGQKRRHENNLAQQKASLEGSER